MLGHHIAEGNRHKPRRVVRKTQASAKKAANRTAEVFATTRKRLSGHTNREATALAALN
jgi:hypothetical protein